MCRHTSTKELVDSVSGDVICTVCGVILCSRLIDECPEWRHFEDSNKADMRRAQSASIGGGLFTSFEMGAGSSSASKALERANSSLRNKADVQIDGCIRMLEDFGSRLNVSDKIVKRAVDLNIRVINNEGLKMRSKESIAGAILYIVCSMQGFPRTLQECSKYLGIEKKILGRISSDIMHSFGLSKGIIRPESLINRMCAQLGIEFQRAELCREMCLLIAQKQILDSLTTTTPPPQNIAAACVDIVSSAMGKPVPATDLERVAMVSGSSIQKVKAMLEPYLSTIKPTKLKEIATSSIKDITNKAAKAEPPSASSLGKRKQISDECVHKR